MQQTTNVTEEKKVNDTYSLIFKENLTPTNPTIKFNWKKKRKNGVWGKKEKEKKPWETAAWFFSQVYLKRIEYRCNSQTGSSCWDA